MAIIITPMQPLRPLHFRGVAQYQLWHVGLLASVWFPCLSELALLCMPQVHEKTPLFLFQMLSVLRHSPPSRFSFFSPPPEALLQSSFYSYTSYIVSPEDILQLVLLVSLKLNFQNAGGEISKEQKQRL